jgi:hypothetical protein
MVGGVPSALDKLCGHLGIVHNRITPLVAPGPLGDQLGAYPVTEAFDPAHAQLHNPH